MKPHGRIFIGLGTNLGDRAANLNEAIRRIEKSIGKTVQKSGVYITPPFGFDAETDFFNQVIELESDMQPEELLIGVKQIESDMGRAKTATLSYESRIIDIDIIDFRGQVGRYANLTIPHEQMHLRDFVLLPLSEICPNWIHPVTQQSILHLIGLLNIPSKAEKMGAVND